MTRTRALLAASRVLSGRRRSIQPGDAVLLVAIGVLLGWLMAGCGP